MPAASVDGDDTGRRAQQAVRRLMQQASGAASTRQPQPRVTLYGYHQAGATATAAAAAAATATAAADRSQVLNRIVAAQQPSEITPVQHKRQQQTEAVSSETAPPPAAAASASATTAATSALRKKDRDRRRGKRGRGGGSSGGAGAAAASADGGGGGGGGGGTPRTPNGSPLRPAALRTPSSVLAPAPLEEELRAVERRRGARRGGRGGKEAKAAAAAAALAEKVTMKPVSLDSLGLNDGTSSAQPTATESAAGGGSGGQPGDAGSSAVVCGEAPPQTVPLFGMKGSEREGVCFSTLSSMLGEYALRSSGGGGDSATTTAATAATATATATAADTTEAGSNSGGGGGVVDVPLPPLQADGGEAEAKAPLPLPPLQSPAAAACSAETLTEIVRRSISAMTVSLTSQRRLFTDQHVEIQRRLAESKKLHEQRRKKQAANKDGPGLNPSAPAFRPKTAAAAGSKADASKPADGTKAPKSPSQQPTVAAAAAEAADSTAPAATTAAAGDAAAAAPEGAATPGANGAKEESGDEAAPAAPAASGAEEDSEARTPKGNRARLGAASESTTPPPICHFFIRGACTHGDKCRYSHGHPQTTPSKKGTSIFASADTQGGGPASLPSLVPPHTDMSAAAAQQFPGAAAAAGLLQPGVPGMLPPAAVYGRPPVFTPPSPGAVAASMQMAHQMMATQQQITALSIAGSFHPPPPHPYLMGAGVAGDPSGGPNGVYAMQIMLLRQKQQMMMHAMRNAVQGFVGSQQPQQQQPPTPPPPPPRSSASTSSSTSDGGGGRKKRIPFSEEVEISVPLPSGDASSFFVATSSSDAENFRRVVDACPAYNSEGGCPLEAWPHKLTHFFTEKAGVHETDPYCIYPEPRINYRTCQVHHKKMWKWEPTTQAWVQASAAARGSKETDVDALTIMTYNVLFDHYMKETIQSTKRYQALMEVLREADCDVICLQEVQPAFLQELLKEEWVRGGYWTSAEAECSSLYFSGVVILSRYPFSSIAVHDLPQTSGNTSPCVFGRLSVDADTEIAICSAHLAQSDLQVKTSQLANLLRITASCPSSVLIGDFNVHALNLGEGYVDTWVESHKDNEGHTTLPSCSSDDESLRDDQEAAAAAATATSAESTRPASTSRSGKSAHPIHSHLGHTISLSANPMAAVMATSDRRDSSSVLCTMIENYNSELRRRAVRDAAQHEAASSGDASSEGSEELSLEVSGRFDCILLKNGRVEDGFKGRQMVTVKGSALVGGKGTCRRYLQRRLRRLCGYLGRDVEAAAAENGVRVDAAREQRQQPVAEAEAAATAVPAAAGGSEAARARGGSGEKKGLYASPPFTDTETLEGRLKNTMSALKDLPEYLCPSDHYFVKTTIALVPSR
eukprot:Rhum_TRINITY_DN14380_c10_g1::Rhum_TRINITY_DN14380_c10_g1_i1::g.84480::m.84480